MLVVDDDASLRKTLDAQPAARGYIADLAGTGEAALRLAASHHPDVIILDLGLPGMDGLEVIAGVRGGPRCRSSCSRPGDRVDEGQGP